MARPLAMATRGKQISEPLELAYLAGIMDADGCISISKNSSAQVGTKNPRYVVAMTVTNTSEDLMKWLVEKFGGKYYRRQRQIRENHKITYDWRFNNGKALWLLKLIEPYLVTKRDRCNVCIDFLENWETKQGGPGSITPIIEVERREALYLEMKRLNRFGIVQPQRLSPLAPHVGDAIV